MWLLYAVELAALVAAHILIGIAFGWVVALILAGIVVTGMGASVVFAARMKRSRRVR